MLRMNALHVKSVAEGKDRRGDDGEPQSDAEEVREKPNKKRASHQCKQHERQLGCEERFQAKKPQRRIENLIQQKSVGVSEHAGRRIKELRISQRCMPKKRLIDMFVQKSDESGVAFVPGGQAEARPDCASKELREHRDKN